MPDDLPTLARATAGQLRRAGFAVEPKGTDDSATTGFEVLSSHTDELSQAEHATALDRGDALPAEEGKP